MDNSQVNHEQKGHVKNIYRIKPDVVVDRKIVNQLKVTFKKVDKTDDALTMLSPTFIGLHKKEKISPVQLKEFIALGLIEECFHYVYISYDQILSDKNSVNQYLDEHEATSKDPFSLVYQSTNHPPKSETADMNTPFYNRTINSLNQSDKLLLDPMLHEFSEESKHEDDAQSEQNEQESFKSIEPEEMKAYSEKDRSMIYAKEREE